MSLKTEPKEAELLLRFAREYRAATRRGVPAKRLAKLLYLSDFVGRQYLGRPISSFRYSWMYFGPYDRAIKAVALDLVEAGFAERTPEWDEENLTIRLTPTPDGSKPLFDFSLGEEEVIRYVVQNYLTMPMKELMNDVIYPSAPMKSVHRRGALLPMSIVDNEGRNAVGFDLEEVLRAEQEIEAGHFSTDL